MKITGTIVAAAALLTFASSASAAEWKAGVAKTVITPGKPTWMAGYATRNHPGGPGKVTDLWCKAFAVEDAGGKRVVFITLDLCGIDRDLSNRIRDRLNSDHHLGRESIAIACSHTHSGPMVGNNLRGMNLLDADQQSRVNEFTAELEEKVVATAGESIKSLAPAKFAWTVGKATFAVNRRENPEAKVPELREKGMLKGPADHELPVLTVTSTEGKLQAIVFGYACHGTTTAMYDWSGDWTGVASVELEKNHPGATAFAWLGCAGDQNPLPRKTYKLLNEYGHQAASAVESAMSSNSLKPIDAAGELKMSYSEIDLPFDTLPTKQHFEEELKSDDKFKANRAKIMLAKLEKEGQLPPHYPYPVEVWKLGKTGPTWVLLGGEVTVDYSLRLKKELGPETTWVGAYTNDVMAYIPSLRVLKEGRYEGVDSMVYYALPTKWGPQVEELIVKEVHRQVEELK
jgi:hypothetical protein